ncbi:hypothetical protein V1478_016366 [Vespula squamosa]|uniref:Maturase K n=1 Tax=Vespula squamosa TaxID=30214 RepID=A0ABD1ZZK3_VESSQ
MGGVLISEYHWAQPLNLLARDENLITLILDELLFLFPRQASRILPLSFSTEFLYQSLLCMIERSSLAEFTSKYLEEI